MLKSAVWSESLSQCLGPLIFLKSGSRTERIANRQIFLITEFCLLGTQWVILYAKGVVTSILIRDEPLQLYWPLFSPPCRSDYFQSSEHFRTWTQKHHIKLQGWQINLEGKKKKVEVELHKWWPSSANTWSMLLCSFATPSNSKSQQTVFPNYRQSNTIWPNKNQIFTFGRAGAAKQEWLWENERLPLKLLGVWGSAVKTYQSQVIPTAVQRCDHHLLINNPY